jgi:transposase-like protein
MGNKPAELIDPAKHLPENSPDKAIESLSTIKKEAGKEAGDELPECPHCGGGRVVRNGCRKGRRSCLCRSCGKSFTATTGTALFNSHNGEAVWKQVIRDTIDGVAIDRTAEELDLHHETVFNMRHKILFCIEQAVLRDSTALTGVCEADETFLLESRKGKKLPDGFWRGAQKRGISNECVCVCAAAERGGRAYSVAVNRAIPGKEEIFGVFGQKAGADALVLCDGGKGYGVLAEKGVCATADANRERDGFYSINAVNGYHSFIKERNRPARGFATKYLNRYNALFSAAYG